MEEKKENSALVVVGALLIVVSIVIFIIMIFFINNRINSTKVTSNAVLFVDYQGKVAVDGTLQAQVPNAIPVTAGKHVITFLGYSKLEPVTVEMAPNSFTFVPADSYNPYYEKSNRGQIVASVFPPDSKISIPNCTPVDETRAVVCESNRSLSDDLSPGKYKVVFTNPVFGSTEKDIEVSAGVRTKVSHSFISTKDGWLSWQKDHGEVLRQYGYGGSGYDDFGEAISLPFSAAGQIFKELF